jgi:hypothetical protein
MTGNDHARDVGREVDDFLETLERERMRRFRLAVYIMLSIVTAGVIALLCTGCSYYMELAPVPGPHRAKIQPMRYDADPDGIMEYGVPR